MSALAISSSKTSFGISGAPDFVFLRRQLIIGYGETKDLGVDLEKVEKGEQIEQVCPGADEKTVKNV